MAKCNHGSLEYVGEQKTDNGQNSYRRCKECGMLLVMTPSGKLIGVPGAKSGHPAPVKAKRAS